MATEKIPDFNQYIKNLKLKQTNNQKPLILGQVKPIGDMRDPKIRSEINKKISEGAKNLTPNNAKNIPLKEAAQKCTNFCRSEGVFILPLRYTVIRTNAPALPATLGSNVKDVAISHFKYGVEMIDTGYIYRLLKRKSGKTEWAGYKVTAKGFLSYFVVGKPAPVTVSEFACKSAGHNFNASMIVIEDNPSDKAQTAYIIHTHVPLSPNKIKEYEKNAEAYAKDGKWQKFDVTSWAGGNTTQTHCLNGSQLNSINNYMGSFGSGRVAAFNKNFKEIPKKYAAMALYDPIGITTAINNYRNLSFSNFYNFLKQSEKGITNSHKLASAQSIDSIQFIISNKIMMRNNSILQMAVTDSIKMNYAMKVDKTGNLLKGEIYEVYEKADAIWQKAPESEKQKAIEEHYKSAGGAIQSNIQSNQILAKLDGEKIWNEKYSSRLNIKAKNDFLTKIDTITGPCGELAEKVEGDHLLWLNSQQFRKSLYAYDENEQKPYGNIFYLNISEAMYGMSGTKKGQKQISDWMGEDHVSDSNIYLRVLCYNQKKNIEEYNKVAKQIFNLSFNDKQEVIKKSMEVFISSHELWGVWISDRKNLVFSKNKLIIPVQKAAYWIIESLNSVIESSIQTSNIALKAGNKKLGEKLGRTAFMIKAYAPKEFNNIPSYSILYKYDERSLIRAARNPNDMFAIVNERRVGLDREIQSYLNKATEHGKTRISIVITALEMINLASQIDKFSTKELLDSSLQVTSALFATFASIMQTSGLALEKVWFSEDVSKIQLAGSILAVAGGFTSLIIDFLSFRKELKQKNINWYLLTLYFSKVLTSFTIVIVGAWTLTAQLMGKKLSDVALKRLALAGALSTYVGWILIGIDYYLKNYVLDNDLQKWCLKCAFAASTSTESKFLNQSEEEKEFNKAIVSI